jgi:hypothetical protein
MIVHKAEGTGTSSTKEILQYGAKNNVLRRARKNRSPRKKKKKKKKRSSS